MSQPANGSAPAAPIGAGAVARGAGPDDASFDVADLVGQASASLGALAGRAGLALVCLVSSAPLRVLGERQRSLDTLRELVGLAAVPQAGPGELRITAAIDGAYVEVAVTHVASGREHPVGALCLPRCRAEAQAGADADGDGDAGFAPAADSGPRFGPPGTDSRA
jgi:hypothetical protein